MNERIDGLSGEIGVIKKKQIETLELQNTKFKKQNLLDGLKSEDERKDEVK